MTRTLHVTIDADPDRDDLEDALAAIEAGDPVDPRSATLSIEDLETFGRVFRPTNLEVLQAVLEHEPESIRALAEAVDRHHPDVLENVRELTDYGLLDLEREGRAKRPVVWYDSLAVDIPLGDRSPEVAPA